MRRREVVARLVLGTALPVVAPWRRAAAQEEPGSQESGASELYDPFRVGRPRDRITDYENDPFIVGVEGRIRCVCGCNLDVYTCRTTDFTCGTSPAMHKEVVGMVEQGMTAQQILDAFVAEHGEMVLMAPKREGFNLLAYFLPGTAVLSVGALLLWVLVRRRTLVAATAGESEESAGLSADERARLDAEFEKLEL